jgi:hypothetical protein
MVDKGVQFVGGSRPAGAAEPNHRAKQQGGLKNATWKLFRPDAKGSHRGCGPDRGGDDAGLRRRPAEAGALGQAVFTTDYMFRSVSNTSQNPAVQPEFDLTYGIFGAGIWGSNTDYGEGIEIDYYAYIKPNFWGTRQSTTSPASSGISSRPKSAARLDGSCTKRKSSSPITRIGTLALSLVS